MKSSLLGFLLRKKRSGLLEWPQIGKFLGYSFAAILSAFLYGLGGGFLADKLIEDQLISVHGLMVIYTLLFSVVFLLLDIFPFLKSSAFQFPVYYPVSDLTKLKVNVTFSLLRHFVFFLLLMQVLLALASARIGWFQVGYSTLVMVSFYTLNRLIKNTIGFKVKQAFRLNICASILLGSSVFFYVMYGESIWAMLLSMVIFSGLFYLYFLSDIHKKTKPQVSSHRYLKGTFFRIMANKNVKILLSIGMGFKFLFLAVFALGYIKKGENVFQMEFLTWMLLSPLILFSYLGYNFYGVNRTNLLTHALREHSTQKLFKHYTDFYIPLFVADAIIFFIFTSVSGLLNLANIFCYFTMLALLFITAFPICLRTPVIKQSYLSMDFTKHGGKNISWTAMIVGFSIVSAAYFARLHEFYWVIDILLVITVQFVVSRFVDLNMNSIARDFYNKMRTLGS